MAPNLVAVLCARYRYLVLVPQSPPPVAPDEVPDVRQIVDWEYYK